MYLSDSLSPSYNGICKGVSLKIRILLVTRPWTLCDLLGHEQSWLTLFVGRSSMTHTQVV